MGKGLDALVGLDLEKEKARIDIAACKVTREPFPHTLLYGPGGLGKTAFARAIAEELGYHFVEVEGASLKNRDKIVHLLVESDQTAKRLAKRLLLFIDEIHRLSKLQQEVFYYPLVEHRIINEHGIEHSLAPFCLIGATTRYDMLDEASFVKRFQNSWRLSRYSQHSIERILARIFNAGSIGFSCESITLIAQRCLGIPRQAVLLSRKIRNQVLARGSREVMVSDCWAVFRREGIDDIGLDRRHRQYLQALSGGRSRGLKALSGMLGCHEEVVVGSIEPILLTLGFTDPGPRGRVITEAGEKHISRMRDEV